jgi:hypothetical protein
MRERPPRAGIIYYYVDIVGSYSGRSLRATAPSAAKSPLTCRFSSIKTAIALAPTVPNTLLVFADEGME